MRVCFLCGFLAPLWVGCAVEAKQELSSEQQLAEAAKLVRVAPEQALDKLALINEDSARLLYLKGAALQAQGKHAQAREVYAVALVKRPADAVVRLALARSWLAAGDREAAWGLLKEGIDSLSAEPHAMMLFYVISWGQPELTVSTQALQTAAPPDQEASRELLLTRAAIETDPARRTELTTAARHATFTKPKATLALAYHAKRFRKTTLARLLVSALAEVSADAGLAEGVARLAIDLGALDAARKALDALAVPSAASLALRGRYALARGDAQTAIRKFQEARKLGFSDIAKLSRLELHTAEAFVQIEDYTAARAELGKVLLREPRHREANWALCEIEKREGYDAAAVRRLEDLTEWYRRDPVLLRRLGDAQMEAHEYHHAEASYRQLAKLRPTASQGVILVSRALREQGKQQQAIDELRAGLQEFGGDAKLLRELAGLYVKSKRAKQAIALVSAATQEKAGDRVSQMLLLAEIYDWVGQAADAKRTLEGLVQQQPQNARAWAALAAKREHEAEWQAAETALRKAVDLEPDPMKYKARLARALGAQQKSQAAIVIYDELLKSDSENASLLNNAAILYGEKLSKFDRAVELAERAHAHKPQADAIADTLGWVLTLRGQPDDLERAVPLLERARVSLASAEVEQHYSELLGRLEKAGLPLPQGAQ